MNIHRIESAAAFLETLSESLPGVDAFKARSHARMLREQIGHAKATLRELDELKYAPAAVMEAGR